MRMRVSAMLAHAGGTPLRELRMPPLLVGSYQRQPPTLVYDLVGLPDLHPSPRDGAIDAAGIALLIRSVPPVGLEPLLLGDDPVAVLVHAVEFFQSPVVGLRVEVSPGPGVFGLSHALRDLPMGRRVG